jgi:K+-sensing histidine kinase KdpD
MAAARPPRWSKGSKLLPPKELEYKGNRLREFDLDAAIAAIPT